MGNVIESFASGIGNVVGKIFSSPIDFLSGKSCSSTCGPTWDLMCYIEHFCIGNLLKLALVFVIIYIDQCGHACLVGSTCGRKLALSCVSCNLKRRTRSRERFDHTSEHDYNSDESLSYYARGSREAVNRLFPRGRTRRNYKSSQLRNSLRPKNHHAQLRINADVNCKYEKRNHIGENLHDGNRKAIIRHGNHHNGTVHDLNLSL